MNKTFKFQGGVRAWVSAVILASLGLAAQAADLKKTPDGQPDVQGFWTAELGGTYSLTNPRRGGGANPPAWFVAQREGKKARANPSRIIDPADGQLPYQAWAREHQQHIAANIDRPTKQEYIDPQARCFLGGVTRTIFWSGFQILQYPGKVVLVFDGNHAWRVIPLDGKPHIDPKIKLWMGDSRGHWEGNTLVVDVRNQNQRHRLSNEGDFASEAATVTERFTFLDGKRFHYESTYTDAQVFTRPWTLAADFKRTNEKEPDFEQWENSCHEGERSAETSFLGDPNAALTPASAQPPARPHDTP